MINKFRDISPGQIYYSTTGLYLYVRMGKELYVSDYPYTKDIINGRDVKFRKTKTFQPIEVSGICIAGGVKTDKNIMHLVLKGDIKCQLKKNAKS